MFQIVLFYKLHMFLHLIHIIFQSFWSFSPANFFNSCDIVYLLVDKETKVRFNSQLKNQDKQIDSKQVLTNSKVYSFKVAKLEERKCDKNMKRDFLVFFFFPNVYQMLHLTSLFISKTNKNKLGRTKKSF
jgi:hypothetical protein